MINHPKTCPHCNFNLDNGDIYEFFISKGNKEKDALEKAQMYGWSKENPKRFSHIVGITDLKLDRVVRFICPKCKKTINER